MSRYQPISATNLFSRQPRQTIPSGYARQNLWPASPLCQAVLDAGGHFIFVCKPTSHPLIQQ
jgi:hypothetical protein